MKIINQRITKFIQLGEYLSKIDLNSKTYSDLLKIINSSTIKNKWFTKRTILFALKNWSNLLSYNNINIWLSKYQIPKTINKKKVALILAGNIPLVGFHDLLCILITGHKAVIKCSSNDDLLIPFLYNKIFEPTYIFKGDVIFEKKRLKHFDAVIATGSNNTSRYFDYYFSKVPNIIRKNRNGISVIEGCESIKELERLAEDVVSYFGLGCRNVSKVFVPKGYDLNLILKPLEKHSYLLNSNLYYNNYIYNKSVCTINNTKYLDNGFIIFKKSKSYSSPVGTLHYEYYEDLNKLKNKLKNDKSKIQCIASKIKSLNSVPYGDLNKPKLWEYADNIDTINFLLNL